jgi:general secretion pathway protein E
MSVKVKSHTKVLREAISSGKIVLNAKQEMNTLDYLPMYPTIAKEYYESANFMYFENYEEFDARFIPIPMEEGLKNFARKHNVVYCKDRRNQNKDNALTIAILRPFRELYEFNYDQIVFVSQKIIDEYLGSNIEMSTGINLENMDNVFEYMVQHEISDLHFMADSLKYKITGRKDGEVVPIANADYHEVDRLMRQIRTEAGEDEFNDYKEVARKIRKVIRSEKQGFRISMKKATSGYSTSIRKLATISDLKSLEDLGYSQRFLDICNRILDVDKGDGGVVAVTGATNSGKTTLLYALLLLQVAKGKRIHSIEKPVEIELDAVIQFDLSATEDAEEEAKDTIPKIMETLLRQDPDNVLISEVRNPEEMAAVYNLGEKGHLTFTTLHANSIPATFSILEKSISVSMLKMNTRAIINQRLVKRKCYPCKGSGKTKNKNFDSSSNKTQVNSEGEIIEEYITCKKCKGVGEKGMVPLYELCYFNQETASKFDMINIKQNKPFEYISLLECLEDQYQSGHLTHSRYERTRKRIMGGLPLEEEEEEANRFVFDEDIIRNDKGEAVIVREVLSSLSVFMFDEKKDENVALKSF